MWLCEETQMISTCNIWLAQDALVYYGLAAGQRHCPVGISLAHVQCSCAAQGTDTCCKRLREVFAGSASFCFLNELETNISVGDVSTQQLFGAQTCKLNGLIPNRVSVVKSASDQTAKPLSLQEGWSKFTKACFGSL